MSRDFLKVIFNPNQIVGYPGHTEYIDINVLLIGRHRDLCNVSGDFGPFFFDFFQFGLQLVAQFSQVAFELGYFFD
jgi:hypothetical protein